MSFLAGLTIFDTGINLTGNASGAILYVNTTGSGGAFTSIQDAINAASPGETVFVYNGTYYETVTVDKTINLTGENRDTTIIHGSGPQNIVMVTEDWVNITGLKINFSDSNTRGIRLLSADDCKIYNNNLSNNGRSLDIMDSYRANITDNIIYSSSFVGIVIVSSNQCRFKNNIMIDSSFDIQGSTLDTWNSHDIDTSNTVNGNQVYYWRDQTDVVCPPGAGQIILVNCVNVTITNQNFENVTLGIELGFSSNVNISNNSFYKCWDGIKLYESDNNEISNNNMTEGGFRGIYLYYSDGNIISGNNISKTEQCITYFWSDSNIIKNNVAFDSRYFSLPMWSNANEFLQNFIYNGRAIHVNYGTGGIFKGNTLINTGFDFRGVLLEDWNTHTLDTSNTVNGKPVYYWKNVTSGIIPSDAGQVILANCTNIKIENFEFDRCNIGIQIGFCRRIYIANNTVTNNTIGMSIHYTDSSDIVNNSVVNDNTYGIYFIESHFNNITLNNASSNDRLGISLHYSDGNKVYDNTAILNHGTGIRLWDSENNSVGDNNAKYNDEGISIGYGSKWNIIYNNSLSFNDYDGLYFWNSQRNLVINNNISSNIKKGINSNFANWNNIICNDISENSEYGVYLSSSAGNKIFHNNFINNAVQGFDDSNDSNDWDNMYPSGGNYWSDYGGLDNFRGPGQNITGGDSIGDTPYDIDSDSKDNYPLMLPYIDIYPPQITLVTPLNNSMIQPGVPIDIEIYEDNIYAVSNFSINEDPDIIFIEPYNISTGSWGEGDYHIHVNSTDFFGNTNYSWFSFAIDYTPPAISLKSPGNNSLINKYAVLDFEIHESHLSHANYSVDGGINNSLIDPFDISVLNLLDGDHIIQINALDLVGNFNSSWYLFTLDSSMPTITLNSPSNNSIISQGTTLDFSVFDPHLLNAYHSINGGSNTPFSDPYDISTSGWDYGNYTVRIDAQDMTGNSNSLWYIFSIEPPKPTILLNSPNNNSLISSGIVLDFSVLYMDQPMVNYSNNGGEYISLPESYDISTTGWADGDYNIQITAENATGSFITSWFSFTIDSTKPTIVMKAPLNNSIASSFSVLDFSVENQHLYRVDYSLNSGSETQLSEPYDIDSSGWSDGEYTILIHTQDLAGNSNSSWYKITIDSIPPEISFDNQLNHSIMQSGETIEVSISDLHLAGAFYSLNHEEYIEFTSLYIIDTSSWEDGTYIITIKANDSAQNEAIVWFEISIDSTAPVVVSSNPQNNAENVLINTTLAIIFSEPISLDGVDSLISLAPSSDYDMFWDEDDTILYISFGTNNLDNGTSYNLTIESQVTDKIGNPMASDFILTFTTKADLIEPDDDTIDKSQESQWIWLLLILAILIVVVLLILIIGQRRKKSQEKQSSTPGNVMSEVSSQEESEESMEPESSPPPQVTKKLPPRPPTRKKR